MRKKSLIPIVGILMVLCFSTVAIAGTLTTSHNISSSKFSATYRTDEKARIEMTVVSYQTNLSTDENFTSQAGSIESNTTSSFLSKPASSGCVIYKGQSYGSAQYNSGGVTNYTSEFFYP